ncbi:MAG: WYL domain-containing protein [Chitinivibrionales bacterium]|nr:WYL domain-containing protein [Chitinivibrionales bacterium]MBD3356890.1 WYL domain-containing protein [Chitinivibrionales bacterium]
MKINRLLAVTVMLLNRRKATARELADHFGVSIRTIYRDIESINSAGIPIVSYQGYEGGFCIMDNYKLDRQLLTFRDMLSILSALKGVNATFNDRELQGAIEKIGALIPGDRQGDYQTHSEQFVMDMLPWGYGKRQQEAIQEVHGAITSSTLLSFTYRNGQNILTDRKVEPMTLVFKPPGWYLFSYCRFRKDYRVFKLSRMKKIRICEEQFIRRDKTYHEFFAPDNSMRKAEEIILKFYPPISARADEWFGEEPVYASDGTCTTTISIPVDEWVYSMILSYGEHVEVLSPPHVRCRVRQKAKFLLQKYSNLT